MFRRDVQNSGSLPCEIPLTDGWNMIGYGYTWLPSVSLADVTVTDGLEIKTWEQAAASGWIQNPAFYYAPGGYRELGTPAPPAHSNQIEPNVGYWLLTYREGLTLRIP
jgi:hypothetical protein